jgi:hypothetical protein
MIRINRLKLAARLFLAERPHLDLSVSQRGGMRWDSYQVYSVAHLISRGNLKSLMYQCGLPRIL